MLEMIDLTLDRALEQVSGKDSYLSEAVQKLMEVMLKTVNTVITRRSAEPDAELIKMMMNL